MAWFGGLINVIYCMIIKANIISLILALQLVNYMLPSICLIFIFFLVVFYVYNYFYQ